MLVPILRFMGILVQVELQLLGAKFYGYQSFGFFYLGGQGLLPSNLTCAAILHMLNSYQEDRASLPTNLYIQMDNCAGDNKNHMVFGFLAHLVQLGVFKLIQVNPKLRCPVKACSRDLPLSVAEAAPKLEHTCCPIVKAWAWAPPQLMLTSNSQRRISSTSHDNRTASMFKLGRRLSN